MIDLGKRALLGVDVDVVDYDSAVARIMEAAHGGRAYSVTALAVHGLVSASRDESLRVDVNAMQLVTPDGQPVRWALNHLHEAGLPDRVYGPELTLRVLSACADLGLPVYFYGSQPRVLESLTAGMTERFPALRVAGCEPSKFRLVDDSELRAIADRILSSGARVCFVGLGCPRQEVFTAAIRAHLPMPALAVGAAFDFHAGVLSQAPAWMQASGLEWFYRLIKEPRRLWRRYLFTNAYFCLAWLRQSMGSEWPAEGGHPERFRRVPG